MSTYSDDKYKIVGGKDDRCLEIKKDGEADKKSCSEDRMAICAGKAKSRLKIIIRTIPT